MNHRLSIIIKACLNDESAVDMMRIIYKKVNSLGMNYSFYYSDYDKVFKVLASTYPLLFLETFEEVMGSNKFIIFSTRGKSNIFSKINEQTLFEWANTKKSIRFPKLASTITPFKKTEEGGLLEWTPLALSLIKNYDNPIVILDELRKCFYPFLPWSGSLAAMMRNCMPLIEILKNHEDPRVVEWAVKEEKVLRRKVEVEEERELAEERFLNERFE